MSSDPATPEQFPEPVPPGLFWGLDSHDQPVILPPSALLKHLACLGASGSGKTVAAKVICEECIRLGIPVIAVDPQGDLASLALPGDQAEAERQGVPAGLWRDFHARAEVVVWTPASTLGVPLSLNPLSLVADGLATLEPDEALRLVSFAAESLAELVGFGRTSQEGRTAASLLTLAIQHAASESLRLAGIPDLIGLLESMPRALADQSAAVADSDRIGELIRRLRMLTLGTASLLLAEGLPLDIDLLLGTPAARVPAAPGKTRLSVIYLNTLHAESERQFFLAHLSQALYRWMLRHPSPTPQALFFIDEVASYIPPVRQPICKEALRLMFRQARKYGVSCLVATQSPGDIDYKVLAQVANWNLGHLKMPQELKKVEAALSGHLPDAAAALVASLPALTPGRFQLVSQALPRSPTALRVRWLVTRHQTLNENAIGEATAPEIRRQLMALLEGDEVDSGTLPQAAPGKSGETAVGRAEVHVLASDGQQGVVGSCEIVTRKGGSGRIVTLGSQSRVKKESVKVAWEAAAQLQVELDLPRDFSRRYDLTVLDTRLAVKKDGPSASLATLVGIVAALRQLIPRPDLALSGEITILGRVLAVGDIALKVQAARDAGFATVILPFENTADIAALPKALQRDLEILTVATIQEVLPIVFGTPRLTERRPLAQKTPPPPALEPETREVSPPSAEVPEEAASPLGEKILELLKATPQALDYDTLAQRLETPRPAVERALRRLEEAKQVKRATFQRRVHFYFAGHALRPDLGMLGPIGVVRLTVTEAQARAKATADLASLLLMFERERIESLTLAYLPLYRVHFAATVTEGWLLNRREVERRDNLYFQAVTGDLLIHRGAAGFAFTGEVPSSPLEVVDLDNLAALTTALPGDLPLDEEALAQCLEPEAFTKDLSRRFGITVLALDRVFFPLWRAEIRDTQKSSLRDLWIDGFQGQLLITPPRHAPRSRTSR
ncbi:MAG: helicase HerA-like domain-containing protein [Pseudomonadota bacterium]